MKCPNCGYDIREGRPINYTALVKELMDERKESTRRVLKNIFEAIREYHSLDVKSIYHLLVNIRNIDDKVVKYTVEQYFGEGHYRKKNINYLKGMILNYYKNRDRILEIEKKIYGTKPPIREI